MEHTAHTINHVKELLGTDGDQSYSFQRSFKLDHAASTPSTLLRFDITCRISFDDKNYSSIGSLGWPDRGVYEQRFRTNTDGRPEKNIKQSFSFGRLGEEELS